MKKLVYLTCLLVLLTLVACGNKEGKETDKNSDKNDASELRIAITTQPTALDLPRHSDASNRDIALNIFETLVTLNEGYQPVPMLADSIDVSDDGKVYTFNLREGVVFHNGKEMTAEDVVASMERWRSESNVAKDNFADALFEEVDASTVTLSLPEPRLDALDLLAGQDFMPAIMPKEIVEAAGDDFVTEYIGTGPFEFVDWKQDQYIHLKKFADYQAVDEPASGLAGKKAALVDQIYFYFTKDNSTLLSGLQSGEYDIGYNIAFDHYDQLVNDENFNVYSGYFGTMNLIYNKRTGLFKDPKMRQAVNAALDAEDIMLGAFANPDLFKLGSSYMSEEVVNWYSDAGKKAYNMADPELAKQLLAEAGYDGEEITLLTNRDVGYHYDVGVIVQEALSQIGMKVKLEVLDWPTHLEKRNTTDDWDLVTGGVNYPTTPTQLMPLNPNFAGWTDDDFIAESLNEIKHALTLEEGQEKWQAVQEYVWTEYLPLTQFGSAPVLMAASSKVEGLKVMDRPIMMPLWNVSVTK